MKFKIRTVYEKIKLLSIIFKEFGISCSGLLVHPEQIIGNYRIRISIGHSQKEILFEYTSDPIQETIDLIHSMVKLKE